MTELEADIAYREGWACIREALEIANPEIDIVLDGRAQWRLRALFIPRDPKLEDIPTFSK